MTETREQPLSKRDLYQQFSDTELAALLARTTKTKVETWVHYPRAVLLH